MVREDMSADMALNLKKIIGALILLSSALAQADEQVEDELLGIYGSEEFISIATGFRQSVAKAPAVASVITAEQIRNMGANDLDDVLESVPGLHVSYSYQGYFPIYTFRGIYSSFNPQVLLLIDGVPQTNLFTGGKNFVWAGMPVEAIERIEIIRGPGSAIYGADAFAGVINIINKGGTITNDSSDLGAKYGSFDSKTLYGSLQRRWDNSTVYLGAQFFKTDGQKENISTDFQSWLDSVTGTSASLAPGSVSLSRENLDLNLNYSISNFNLKGFYQRRRNAGNGAGISQALDPSSSYKSDRIQLKFDYSLPQIVNQLDVNIEGSFLDVTQEIENDTILFPAGSTGPFLSSTGQPLFGIFPEGVIGNPEVFERHSRLNTTFHYEGFEAHDLSAGVGYYYGDLHKVREKKNYCTDFASCLYIIPRLQTERLVDVSNTPYVFLEDGNRKNRYVYLQDVYSFANDWQVTAGVRYDDYSDFGDTLNPRLAVVWSTSKDLTTKFLFGKAFRAPSFQETNTINNPAVQGNPDLEPEKLKSYELVFDYNARHNLDIVLNTFFYEWDDIILFVPDASGPPANAENFGRQKGHGVEIESNWRVTTGLDVTANFAWQKSTNTKTDSDAANSPTRQFYLQTNWEFIADTLLNLQANWVMDRKREELDPRSNIDDYFLIDLTLRRTNLWQSIEADLTIKNLFDKNAREPTPNGFPVPGIPNDLPLAGRSIMGVVRYKF